MTIHPGRNVGAGRPAGVRNKLSRQFLEDLLASWRKHGPAALEDLRIEDPVAYVRVVASTLPKELVFEATMNELSDTDLDELIVALKQHMLTRPGQPMLLEGKAINGHDSGIPGEAGRDALPRGSDQAAARERE